MDPATVIALCKENIQPLRYGRNASQLGTALRAQDDADAQQILLQERQMYEDAIKNYEGNDPLENWYEYILWIEQSYPKSGHESPLARLLQQCLAAFEKDTKYHQDRRYIRLWINYISMQKNPLELYQLLHNNGIGTMVADTYRAWAFELEQIEDYKRADEVYLMGLSALAEPREELEYAHKNFQLAVARKTLGRTDDRSEVSLSEQRQAFSSLRAIKAGRKIGSIRTGHRMREHYPGTIPQVPVGAHGAKSNSKIHVYQDDVGCGDGKAASILDHVPIEDTVHKENTIKPGPWSSGGKRGLLITTTVKTSFKVHEDTPGDLDMNKVRLFPNHTEFFDGSKYQEHSMIPVYVADPPNPNILLRAHYPKDVVYANNADRSMEEIRAEIYVKRRSSEPTQKQEGQRFCLKNTAAAEDRDQNVAISLREIQDREFVQVRAVQREMREHGDMDRLAGTVTDQRELERQCYVGESQRVQDRSPQSDVHDPRGEQRNNERGRESELERHKKAAEQEEFERIEAQRIEAERIEAEQIEAERMEAEFNAQQQKLRASDYMQQHIPVASNEPEEHLLGQSITVNTKEAMSVVQDLWHSPDPVTVNARFRSPVAAARMLDSRTKLSFDIHMDSSMTQHAMSSNKHHPDFNVRPYNDQENNQNYAVVYPGQEQQNSYRGHSLPAGYHFHLQQHLSQAQPLHPQHHPHLMQPQQQAHVTTHHQAFPQAHSSPHSPLGHHQTHGGQLQHEVHPQHQYHQQIQGHHHHHTTHQHSMQQSQHHSSHDRLAQQHPSQPVQEQSQHHLSSHNQQLDHHRHHEQEHQQQQHQQQHQQQQQQQHHHPHHPHHHHHNQQQQQQQQLHHPHHHHQQQQQQQAQHLQHSMYANIVPNDIGYEQYPSTPNNPLSRQTSELEKSLHFAPYCEPDVEPIKPYKMPSELPYIKSPGMNRRDLKYLENAENKENAVAVEYNGPTDENMLKQTDENNLYIDESLGISPLTGTNDTCFTEAFNTQLASSTPMPNHFRQSYRTTRDVSQYSSQSITQQPIADVANGGGGGGGDAEDKLSVILESTREYISSSSGSSAHTRTTGLGFTLTREDLIPIKEQSIDQDEESNESLVHANHAYEQKFRHQAQAVHAQSPRTVQRNVDQITSEIKNNCDLRKSINLKLNAAGGNTAERLDLMECEEQEPMDQAEDEIYQLPSGDINPFDKGLIAGLLKRIKFPRAYHADGYVKLESNLNKLVPSTMITLGTEAYDVDKCLGKGMYGTVFKATDLQTGQVVALKMQKPGWVWEYYITREIKARITNSHMLRGFMDVSRAYIADNGSVLVSEYSKYGTLLAVTNQIKIASGKPLAECLAIFFTIEMLHIVEYLHKCRIIHGDIKPDNFLLMRLPTEDVRPTIQLIDFGCSIDMTLLPESTTFKQIIKTEDFTCIEMQTGRRWTYQTDLYCLAATSHCLLFGNYMRVTNTAGRWFISSKLPRYAKKAAWEQFFTELLNIESCDKLPDLCKLRNMMEETLAQISEAKSQIRTFVNVLNKR